MSFSVLFLVAAFIIFTLGAWSRWWSSPQPYYPAFISFGLALLTLSFLWPQLTR